MTIIFQTLNSKCKIITCRIYKKVGLPKPCFLTCCLPVARKIWEKICKQNSKDSLFRDGGPYHIETMPLICRAHQCTGFVHGIDLCHERVKVIFPFLRCSSNVHYPGTQNNPLLLYLVYPASFYSLFIACFDTAFTTRFIQSTRVIIVHINWSWRSRKFASSVWKWKVNNHGGTWIFESMRVIFTES